MRQTSCGFCLAYRIEVQGSVCPWDKPSNFLFPQCKVGGNDLLW